MTLLVTGAGGFVGLNLLETMLSDGKTVVALNDRPLFPPAAAVFAGLPGTLDLVIADVRSRDQVAKAFEGRGITRVIHAAAITLGPAAAIAPADVAIDVNVIGTRNVLEAAMDAGVERFVYPSSSTVYGTAPFRGVPVSEDVEPRPTGIYGFTKLASERLVLAAAAERGLDAVMGRITAVFGRWEHDTGYRETLSPPFQLAGQALAGAPVRLPQGGTRDWTSSRDVARALLALAEAKDPPRRLYNISTGRTWHPTLLADALSRRLGRPVATAGADAEATVAFNDDLSSVRSPLDARRIREDLGVAFMPPEEAVEDYADWLMAMGPGALGGR